MRTRPPATPDLPAKLIAVVVVAACLLVGAVGLILPIVPGLLFLAVAAVIAARHFPSLRAALRRNTTVGRHLDRADGALDLPLARQLQLAALLCAKGLVEGLAWIGNGLARLSAKGSRARR